MVMTCKDIFTSFITVGINSVLIFCENYQLCPEPKVPKQTCKSERLETRKTPAVHPESIQYIPQSSFL